MLKLLGNVTRNSLASSSPTTASCFFQQMRTTFILKRRFKPDLARIGALPRKLKGKHRIYELVEDTDIRPAKTIDVILTDYVEGIGHKGELVNIKCTMAREQLLLPKLAVYASPENILRYKKKDDELPKDAYSSIYSTKIAKCLAHTVVTVTMNMDNPWTIEPWHVKAAGRHSGVILTDQSITLPDKPVCGPNMELEGKVFIVKIKINNCEEALMRCRITHWTTDISRIPVPIPADAPMHSVFPEDEALLASLPAPTDLKSLWYRYQ